MFTKYFLLFAIIHLTLANNNNCQNYIDKYEHLSEDYNTMYNTSLTLYLECTKRLDDCNDLNDQELEVNNICFKRLEEYESLTENLTQSTNYTNQIKLLKENIKLESDLHVLRTNLTEKLQTCEQKKEAEYLLIAEYKTEISALKANLSEARLDIYDLDKELNQCKLDLEKEIKKNKAIFSNLNDSLEREELLQEQKNKYVLRLTTCRKNKRKLKGKKGGEDEIVVTPK